MWGEGSDEVSLFEEQPVEEQLATVAREKAWAALRFDAGFGWIDGPVELGGRGLTRAHRQAYAALERGYDVPIGACLTIGIWMVAPPITAQGSPELQRAYLPGLHRGDLLACQLFSEPGAGSDLASLTTSAVRDGDDWIVSGQKVWTSNAHVADIGMALCRTDPDAPRHRGITCFLVDMHAPGVTVRPIRQMTGGAGFNEVFLDDVRVPDSHRLGDVGAGWSAAMTTLGNERTVGSSGLGLAPGPGPFERWVELVRHHGDPSDPLVRQRLAELYTHERITTWTLARGTAALRAGQAPGPEMSIVKLRNARKSHGIADLATAVLGPRLAADTGEWGTFAWHRFVCGVPGARIGGGTDEVQRTIVGERVLGLPKEPPAGSRP
ncbi:MAG: acyl-CoA dehydrogenase [Acidimicrobiia bacterium]